MLPPTEIPVNESENEQLLAAIAELARERFDWQGDLEASARLIEDLGLDSLKLMELAIAIENRFQIRIDEASEAEIVTVGDLVRIITDQLPRNDQEYE